MPSTQELAPCQRWRGAWGPYPRATTLVLPIQELLRPRVVPLCPESPGCGPAGEELTPEVPAGLTVPATAATAAAAASGREEEAGAARAPGALQSGGCCAGSGGPAQRGQGRPPGGAPRWGGRGSLV